MHGNFKREFSIKIMSAATRLARATEEKINQFSEKLQNKSEPCMKLVEEAEKITHLAEDREKNMATRIAKEI